MYNLVDIFAVIGLLLVLYLLGFRVVRRGSGQERYTEADRRVEQRPEPAVSREPIQPRDVRSIMLAAISQPPFTDVLTRDQRSELHQALLNPPKSTEERSPDPVPDALPAPVLPTAAEPLIAPTPAAPESGPQSKQQPRAMPEKRPVSTRPAPSDMESIRASWDPAVMLLYLGALMVVVAGLIYAGYNWGDLGGWQKLGLLLGGTLAFLITGLALRNVERIRPAARTFVIIGGLLVPANVLAAYTIFNDASISQILLPGAIVTAVVHGILGNQDGSGFFRYSSVVAFILAIATIPSAIGFEPGWGAVLALGVLAIPPDPQGRLESFSRSWVGAGSVMIIPLAMFGFWRSVFDSDWIVTATLVGVSLCLIRLSQRASTRNESLSLRVLADGVLVLALLHMSWMLTGDRWLVHTLLLAVTLLLLRYGREISDSAPVLEVLAAGFGAAFIGVVVEDLANFSWAGTAGFGLLAGLMLALSRRWPRLAPVTDGFAAIALPIATGSLFVALNADRWAPAAFFIVFTATLVAWRMRHHLIGDIPLMVASWTGIAAVVAAGIAARITDDTAWMAILLVTGLVWNGIGNEMPRYGISRWLRNVLRVEALFLYAFSALPSGDYEWIVLAIAMVAMFWNTGRSRHAIWTLPGALLLNLLFVWHVVPSRIDASHQLWWVVALAAILSALAWQLDRRSASDDTDQLPSGIWVWGVMAFGAVVRSLQITDGLDEVFHLNVAIPLLVIGALHVMAMWSSRLHIFTVLAIGYAVVANILLLGIESTVGHVVIAMILLALAVYCYLRVRMGWFWLGFVALVLAVLHVNAVIDQPATIAVLPSVMVSWLLLGWAITRWRDEWQFITIGMQAAGLHVVAIYAPQMGDHAEVLSQQALVLVMVSLAGGVAISGMHLRDRMLMLAGSAIGMVALLLQVNLSSPDNIHVYTVPMAIYFLGLGLLVRRDPRIANVLLAIGSGMLVVPAMLEALSTGSMTWLWISLGESLVLFLLGVVLRLRVPTAAGVIAVSVILLRMLVFVINALASWVSILAIGIALLAIGTLWLVFRDALQARAQVVFDRWRRFD